MAQNNNIDAANVLQSILVEVKQCFIRNKKLFIDKKKSLIQTDLELTDTQRSKQNKINVSHIKA